MEKSHCKNKSIFNYHINVNFLNLNLFSENLKIGTMAHKEIFENLIGLNSIDNMIDEEIQNELNKFNPKNNDDLRMNILSQQTSYIPSRDKKITELVEYFVENKEKELKKKGFITGK